MKVLHVINSLAGSGGAEQGLVREISHFDESVRSVVVRLFEADDLEPLLGSQGIRVVPLGLQASNSSWSWPEATRRLRRLIRTIEPDVVHTSLFIGNLVGQLAARRAGIPVLSTLTLTGDELLHRQLQPGAGTRRSALLRSVAARVGRHPGIWYRAISEDTASTNCRLMGLDPSRVVVIPRGVPPMSARPDRARFGIPAEGPLIVNVGRQAAQKGHVLLLQAFQSMRVSMPNIQLAIAGREGDASEAIVREIDSLGLGDSVHMLGYRTDIDVLLASADVFVFSSLAEGLGTALLEALAAGRPVVAFDIPPVREVGRGRPNVHLVTSGDVDLLSRVVLSVLQDPTCSARTAETDFARRFTITRVAKSVQELLEHVARWPGEDPTQTASPL
jgi:glycosyltransferase involved in cell wall biosynthesis